MLLEFTGVAVVTALDAGISASATDITLKNGSGWPTGIVGPFIATIGDPDANDSLEKVLVTGGRTGNVLSGCTRGYEGSAQIWGPNTKIRHTISATFAQEISLHVNDPTRHDHTQYLRAADHAAIGHTAAMLDPDSVGNSELQDNAVATANIQDAAVATAKLTNLNVTLGKLETAVQEALVPVGSITAFGGSSAPTGWLFCDGSLVSRATYAALFAIVSTTFGAGDGVNTFQLPDLRQRFPMGHAASGTGSTLGGTGGTIDHTHDLASATSHAKITLANDAARIARKTVTAYNDNVTFTADDGATAVTSASQTTGAELGGASASANPPFQVVKFIIKT